MLSPGIHSFPFKLGLPPGLPSTFLGKSGWVQYYCKAALREPNSLTHKNQQVFIVMNPIDLNMEPSILSVVKPIHILGHLFLNHILYLQFPRYRNHSGATSITSFRKPCVWGPVQSSVRYVWTKEPMYPAKLSRSRLQSLTTVKSLLSPLELH